MSEELTINPALVVCKECSGVMRYRGGGLYVCEECKHEELDDYGKVRQFLEKREHILPGLAVFLKNS